MLIIYLSFKVVSFCMQFTLIQLHIIFPKYFQTKQYYRLSISVLLITAVTYILFMLNLFWITDSFNVPLNQQLLNGWFSSMNFIINGPPVICAMFLTCKMLKNLYIKMVEKQTLTKENANAELQLLKGQVHPHFLFNTLNNIYSFTLDKSSEAGALF